MDVNELSDAWFGLKSTDLKSLNLRKFRHKSSSQPQQVYLTRFFRYFNFDNLTELFLDDVGIAGASVWKFSKQTKNLRTLSLSNNYLNHSQINKLLTNIGNLTKLTSLDLSSQLPRNSQAATQVRIDVDLPLNLEKLDLSKILVWPSLPNHDLVLNLRRNNNLKWFGLTNNYVDQIATPFIHSPNPDVPVTVNLNYNRLTSLAFLNDSVVRGLRIRELYLTDNMLGRTMGETVFENFHHLERLDLTSNGIKLLTGKVFSNQKHLIVLKLAANCLWLIDFEFTHMSNLTALDLSGNSLTYLNTETRDRIDRLKRISPKFVINSQRNPLECSCSNLPFIQWAYGHKTTFVTFDNNTCVYHDKLVRFADIDHIIRNLNYECSMNLAMKLSASLLALVIVMTGLSVFLYRHRWDVRFFFIKFVEKRNVYLEREGYRGFYEYDAFVAYHKSDLNWVRYELYNTLDQDSGDPTLKDQPPRYRLCIHDRGLRPRCFHRGQHCTSDREQSEDHPCSQPKVPNQWMVRVWTSDGSYGKFRQGKESRHRRDVRTSKNREYVEKSEIADPQEYLHRVVHGSKQQGQLLEKVAKCAWNRWRYDLILNINLRMHASTNSFISSDGCFLMT